MTSAAPPPSGQPEASVQLSGQPDEEA